MKKLTILILLLLSPLVVAQEQSLYLKCDHTAATWTNTNLVISTLFYLDFEEGVWEDISLLAETNPAFSHQSLKLLSDLVPTDNSYSIASDIDEIDLMIDGSYEVHIDRLAGTAYHTGHLTPALPAGFRLANPQESSQVPQSECVSLSEDEVRTLMDNYNERILFNQTSILERRKF